MDLYVVSECCPVPCGVEVVLLKRKDTASVFCHCDACGLAWATAAEAHFEADIRNLKTPFDFAPNGVVYPALEEIRLAGFEDAVISTIEMDDYWSGSLSYTNAEIEKRLRNK